MTQKDRLDQIEKGRAASMIESLVGPWINERIGIEVQLMVAEYRGGQMTHDQMVGRVAGMAMMFTMASELQNLQRRAEGAAEKEFGNAKEKA